MFNVQVHAPMMLPKETVERLATFVQSQSEDLTSWDSDKLILCWITSITKEEYQVAVVWHHPVIHLHPSAMMMHAAVAKKYRKRWLTKKTLREIFLAPELAGALRLYANVTSPEIEIIWRKLGFTIYDDAISGRLAYKDAQ